MADDRGELLRELTGREQTAEAGDEEYDKMLGLAYDGVVAPGGRPPAGGAPADAAAFFREEAHGVAGPLDALAARVAALGAGAPTAGAPTAGAPTAGAALYDFVLKTLQRQTLDDERDKKTSEALKALAVRLDRLEKRLATLLRLLVKPRASDMPALPAAALPRGEAPEGGAPSSAQ